MVYGESKQNSHISECRVKWIGNVFEKDQQDNGWTI